MASDEQIRSAFRILGQSTEEQVPQRSPAVLRQKPRRSARTRVLLPALAAGAVAAVSVGVVVLSPGSGGRPSDVVTAPPASASSTAPVDVTPPAPTVSGPVVTSPVTAATSSSGTPPTSKGPSAGPPGAPSRVAAAAGGPRTVVTWAPPAAGASRVTGYLVEVLDTAGGVVTAPKVGGAERMYVFESLRAGEYTVRVSAVTAAGTGPGSTTGTFSVRTVPQAAPTIRGAAAVGGGAVLVSWDPVPADQAGNTPVTGYGVHVYDVAGTEVRAVGAASDATSLRVELTAGVTYRFRVVSLNAYGGSPFSVMSAPVTAT